eukprot:TRINITY_DN4046_c0_g1_i1.p1 TRINITY_DN4046_c0_g1~~TRINITY_DN4046_c0_g1_i1.p1  ORF type:complete len:398 (+),score=67.60 TRINITY_DN4046_c0_g1_i1:90-1283(+)
MAYTDLTRQSDRNMEEQGFRPPPKTAPPPLLPRDHAPPSPKSLKSAQSSPKLSLPHSQKFQVDEICEALYHEDGKWYQAKIKQVPNSSHGKYLIVYVEYNVDRELPLFELRKTSSPSPIQPETKKGRFSAIPIARSSSHNILPPLDKSKISRHGGSGSLERERPFTSRLAGGKPPPLTKPVNYRESLKIDSILLAGTGVSSALSDLISNTEGSDDDTNEYTLLNDDDEEDVEILVGEDDAPIQINVEIIPKGETEKIQEKQEPKTRSKRKSNNNDLKKRSATAAPIPRLNIKSDGMANISAPITSVRTTHVAPSMFSTMEEMEQAIIDKCNSKGRTFSVDTEGDSPSGNARITIPLFTKRTRHVDQKEAKAYHAKVHIEEQVLRWSAGSEKQPRTLR